MHKKLASFFGLVVAAAFFIGCRSTPASNTSAEEPPDGSQFVCHLDCSGKEAKAYGATESEARANVGKFVETICKPEDGQHFIFCDPPE